MMQPPAGLAVDSLLYSTTLFSESGTVNEQLLREADTDADRYPRAPGADRGTQGVRLSAVLGIPAISIGDLFHEEVRIWTPLGVHLQTLVAADEFASIDLTIDIVATRLRQIDARAGFIFDDYPHKRMPMERLTRLPNLEQVSPIAALPLEAPDDVLMQRLSTRADQNHCSNNNTLDVICHRLAPYHLIAKPTRCDCRIDGVGA